ncbi:MAG: antitoxin [Candidatus Brocadia sp. WS118]|nr:MAG: antitoxin [Candidatus Brocadia sp. WS118]
MVNALISVNPKICGGAPCIAGTRIMVSTILSQLAGGYSIEKILEGYPQLSREQVVAAIEYALALVQDEVIEVVGA